MALQEFWINVRSGAKEIAPFASIDTLKLDFEKMDQALRSSENWLTLDNVEGFDEHDFTFLPESEHRELAGLVERYRDVADEVAEPTVATQEQLDRAVPIFLKVVELLAFDRYEDPEAYRIGKQVETRIRSKRPAVLADVRFKTALDSTGDPGLWIWAIFADEVAEKPEFRAHYRDVRKMLESATRKVSPERWPYVHVRTVTEHREIIEGLTI